jgi:hypothetical protein
MILFKTIKIQPTFTKLNCIKLFNFFQKLYSLIFNFYKDLIFCITVSLSLLKQFIFNFMKNYNFTNKTY